MKAVHFGAGNIGRGFIGKVLHDNGFEVTFADVNDEIIDALNNDNSYTVHIAEENGEAFEIAGVSGINTTKNLDALHAAILESDIITTAVGVNILPFIAKNIAASLPKRLENMRPLNIIACENAVMATAALKEAITDEIGEITADHAGFPNSAVDRIVPIQTNENILDVKVEPFFEWVIEKDSWAGDHRLDGVNYVADLMPFIERKMFTVNTGHAAIAYFGKTLDYDTVAEAMTDARVKNFLDDVLTETMDYVTSVYDFTTEEQQTYINEIIKRFTNPYLSDGLNRVGRGVMRKLGPRDRIIKPLVYLHEQAKPHASLSRLAGLAVQFDDTDDPEQVEMNKLIEEFGVEGFLSRHSGLSDDLITEITNQR